MNAAEKTALAMLLLRKAGDIAEFWGELVKDEPALAEVSSEDAAEQLTVWLKRLPGDRWDLRLPQPR